MPWFKVDDGFATSEPVMRIKRRYRASVIGLWTLSGTWCAKELTDGRVPFHMIEELSCTKSQADLLVECGLWSSAPEGYVFVGWEKYQPTRAKVEAERKKEADRKAAYRMSRGDTARTPPGHPEGHQPESGHPDPTRPDPTSITSNEVIERPAKRGSRLSENWLPSAESVAVARTDAPDVDHKAEHPAFIDYWIAQPGQKGVKTNWDATWRNWMRRKQGDLSKGGRAAPVAKADQNAALYHEIYGGGNERAGSIQALDAGVGA